MYFAARGARISLMSTNQGKRKEGTKEMIENRNVNIITDADGKKYLEGYVGVLKKTARKSTIKMLNTVGIGMMSVLPFRSMKKMYSSDTTFSMPGFWSTTPKMAGNIRHSGNKKRNEQAVTRCTVKTHFLLLIISLYSILSSTDFFFFAESHRWHLYIGGLFFGTPLTATCIC